MNQALIISVNNFNLIFQITHQLGLIYLLFKTIVLAVGEGVVTKNVTVMKFRFMFSTLYNWPDIFAPLVDISFEIFQKVNLTVQFSFSHGKS